MKPVFKIVLSFFLFSVPCLQAQPSGYTLVKTSDSTFVATNSTSTSGKYFLLLAPNGPAIQSAVQERGPSLSIQGSNGTSVIGPFSIGADSSVTLQLALSGSSSANETFALLTEARLNQASIFPLTSNSSLSTPNSADQVLLRSAVAAPNVSRGNQPIDFRVGLDAPAVINLSLFTLAGEKVYGAQAQGNAGMNSLTWNLSDFSGGQVSSGLYLYYLRVVGIDSSIETRTGKVLVLH